MERIEPGRQGLQGQPAVFGGAETQEVVQGMVRGEACAHEVRIVADIGARIEAG